MALGGKTARRFYREACATAADGAYGVALDGRLVKTPAGHTLTMPTHALADAVAAEWQAQATTIEPESMPLTRLVVTTLDRSSDLRAGLVKALARYAETDLLCYRAVSPEALVAAQHACWQPLLDWAGERWGLSLVVTSDITPVTQPDGTLECAEALITAFDEFALTALSSVVAATGSLVIGLAVVDGRITADAAHEAAHLDEVHQEAEWGADAEAESVRLRRRDDVRAAVHFLSLARHRPEA